MKKSTGLQACLVLVVLSLGGCGSPAADLVDSNLATSTRQAFIFCSDFGCSTRWQMGLENQEWAEVQAFFTPPPSSAEEERIRIAQAVGRIEIMTGRKAGTLGDRPGAAILPLHSTRGQHDCIDEAYNTTLYLTFMERDGLLRWHKVGRPANRGNVLDGWFHNTATVVENDSGAAFAIDSWFGANGAVADIVPLDTWRAGWSPDEVAAR